MRRAKSLVVGIICLAIAVLFIILGINSIKNQNNFTHTEGVITDIQMEYVSADDTDYTVFVAYTVDGTEYESELGEYSSSMKVGKTIKICYDPEDPGTIESVGAFKVILMFGIAILSIFGAFASIFRRRR